MNPNQFGKRLGIGVRIAGRIAQERMQEPVAAASQPTAGAAPASSGHVSHGSSGAALPTQGEVLQQARNLAANRHKYTRAAGRGVGGFLRPFGRVGGILWLQMTGFFFGMFALYFAQDIWRTHQSYANGPQHQRFLIAVGMTLLFGYLAVSAFWRAKRR